MFGEILLAIVIQILFCPSAPAVVFAQSSHSGYAPVNDLKMYYEIHGTGQPLVLLHGAYSAIGTSFGKLWPTLAKSRQVIALELQGHGRTADIDRPITYELMADDVAPCCSILKSLVPTSSVIAWAAV